MQLFHGLHLVIFWSTVVCLPSASAKRRLLPADTTALAGLVDLVVSPTGRKAVYTQSDFDKANNVSLTSLWMLDVDDKTTKKLNTSQFSQFSWAPDESRYCYLSGDNDEGVQQLHCAPAGANTATVLTRLPPGVADYIWSPNGEHIAMLTKVPPAYDTLPGVHMFTNALYVAARGYQEFPSSAQIWVVGVTEGANPKLLTTLNTTTNLVSFSANNSEVLYTTDSKMETYYGNNTVTLRSVRVSDASEVLSTTVSIPAMQQGVDLGSGLLPNPDGTRLAFTMPDPKAPPEFAQVDVYVLDLATMNVTCLTNTYDFDIGDILWGGDDTIFAISYKTGNSGVIEIDVTSHSITPWPADKLTIYQFGVSIGNNRVLAVASDFQTPTELYQIEKSGSFTVLTKVNAWFRELFDVAKPENIAFKGPGGQTIHGWLYRPPDFDSSQKYPLLIDAHGGPFFYWDAGFHRKTILFTHAGYMVLLVNPRGSFSYGQKFAAALEGSWPGLDFDDYMAGLDYVLTTYPCVDRTKLGIVGGSAGGALVDWTITHTNRFAAAVSISDIANFQYYWFVGDQADFTDFRTKPWQIEDEGKRSAINHVHENLTTPTLWMMGDRDSRTPPSIGSQPMYRIWKLYRIPTALVVFEGAGHGGEGDDPRFRATQAEYTIKWLDLHIFGKPAPEFDVLGVQ